MADTIAVGTNAVITSKATGSYNAGNITFDGKRIAAGSGTEIDASASKWFCRHCLV